MTRGAKTFVAALVFVLVLIMVTKHSHTNAAPAVPVSTGVTQ